ncbi:MAG TPA: c-type cytochrome [Terracidiphilus sp.]|nr:c-type cytochrome [Terracidiphilus sp.]
MASGVSALTKVKGIRFVLLAAAVVVVSCFAMISNGIAVRAADQAQNASATSAASAADPGAETYAQHCAICHGEQREGNLPGFPPLLGVSHRMADDKITDLIHGGKGRMPAFPSVQDGELTALLHFLNTAAEPTAQTAAETNAVHTGLSGAGEALFQQNCAFCHGRDAMGGETGPDLTQSRLVRRDHTGDEIAKVIHEGRPDNKMPPFNFSAQEVRGIIAFIHERQAEAVAHPGGRRGVSVADLQTGNAESGKRYFEGAGGCAKCHSPSGDLAGIASRYEGLELEERMLYPRNAKSEVTVTSASGEKLTGTLAYLDEFTVALHDANGIYHSWLTSRVHYTVHAPVEAHVELFSKYTDDDIHNLMAYLQTLH